MIAPAAESSLRRFRNKAAAGGLMLFALFSLWSVALANVGLAIVFICFLSDRDAVGAMVRHPIFWNFLAIAVYLIVRGHLAAQEFPSTAGNQARMTKDYLMLWAFLPVAFCFRNQADRFRWAVLLMLLGMLGGVFTSEGWYEAILSQERTGFHLRSISLSLYALSGIIASLTILHPLSLRHRNRGIKILFLSLLIVLNLFLLEIFLIAQSRSTWIAGLIVLPAILLFRMRWFPSPKARRLFLGVLLFFLFAGGGVFAYSFPAIAQRFTAELHSYQENTMVESTVDSGALIPDNSLRIRERIYRHGLEAAGERFWFGWGPGSSRFIMSLSRDPALRTPDKEGHGKYIDHFHNFYLEMVILGGFAGAVLMSFPFVWLIRRSIFRPGDSKETIEFKLFFLGCLGSIVIWSFFDVRQFHFDFRFFWIVLAGGLTGLLGLQSHGRLANDR